ncbi:uncharacterized protein LOC118826992 isoform X1 [Colossoma macropomum]|uniref:uncharacterized protein LOC118826992 isoform X1 n=1 Tax=Colossoma macropomum TaxID=42526 RepID=UPI0018644277|nr:uncharacterized protein LOC118826992 isoform X1 [Colossoma macropomum]XP_036454039.1 uncharacterized protein LOC118826992 isoform X1 [Colossoma macropomum]
MSESAFPLVKVGFLGSATLPCSERCSGLVRWTVFTKPTDVLAECDQTSCRSVKEGYQMIHDQYLKGNLSLTITDADFTKRGWYTCQCDGREIYHWDLQVEPLKTSVQIKPGESLVMKLDVSDPVEVIYNSTDPAGPSSDQICTVNGNSLQCKPEYTHRVSLITSALELRKMTPSDRGNYIIMDINKEAIHIYTVTVQDEQPCVCGDQGAAVPVWAFVLLLVVCVALWGVNMWLWRRNLLLQKRCESNGLNNHGAENMKSLSTLTNKLKQDSS